jgi:hypothetical protein
MSSPTGQPTAQTGQHCALGPLVVTDMELSELEGAHRRLLAGSEPVGQEVEDSVPAGGAREARRSLMARGLLDESGGLAGADDISVLVTTVLDVRLGADLVLVVERVEAVGGAGSDGDGAGTAHAGEVSSDPEVRRGTRLVHLVASGACVEDLLPDGSHHLYLLLDRADVVAWVTAVTVPRCAVAGTGPVRAVHPDRPEEIPLMLGHPCILVELSVIVPDQEVRDAVDAETASPAHHLLALGRSGCWVTEVDPGRSLPETVLFRPVHPGWVGEWVRSALDDGGVPP